MTPDDDAAVAGIAAFKRVCDWRVFIRDGCGGLGYAELNNFNYQRDYDQQVDHEKKLCHV